MANIYDACLGLFAGYPLAAETTYHHGKTVRSMVLMLQHDDDPKFFRLSHESGEGKPSCSLFLLPAGDIVDIKADGRSAVPDVITDAVDHGVPIPPHGSLFGWNDKGVITALTTFETQDTMPAFASLIFASIPKTQWPPHTEESWFGHWFWDSHKAGTVVSLADLISKTPKTVYWVDTRATLGSVCYAVARDVKSSEGPTLRRGRYFYYEVLRARMQLPSLWTLLTYPHKADLAQRF